MTDNERPLDPNDAPEGYVAEAIDDLPACAGCEGMVNGVGCSLRHSRCCRGDRPDGHRVRFVKRPAPAHIPPRIENRLIDLLTRRMVGAWDCCTIGEPDTADNGRGDCGIAYVFPVTYYGDADVQVTLRVEVAR